MSAKFLTIALLAAVSAAHSPAFAQYRGGEVGEFASAAPSTGQLTRAAVRADVMQARRTGTLPSYGEGADIGRTIVAANTDAPYTTRAEVRGAYLQAARTGTLPSIGEGADIGHVAAADPSAVQRTRAEVYAEAVHAVRNGLTVGGEV